MFLDSRGVDWIDLKHQKIEIDVSDGPIVISRAGVSIINGFLHFVGPDGSRLRGGEQYNGIVVSSPNNYIEVRACGPSLSSGTASMVSLDHSRTLAARKRGIRDTLYAR